MLYHLCADGHAVRALGVDYGQRHRRELDAARRICALLGVPYEVVPPSSITRRKRTGPVVNQAQLLMWSP